MLYLYMTGWMNHVPRGQSQGGLRPRQAGGNVKKTKESGFLCVLYFKLPIASVLYKRRGRRAELVQTEMKNSMEVGGDDLQGKYLTFSLGEDILYGMAIRNISEIISLQEITQMPEMPVYIKGITNLRGKVIPIMDARLRFQKEEHAYNERTCIIVFDRGEFSIGLIVDSVDEVREIQDENVVLPPEFRNMGKGKGYVQNIGKVDGKIILLLDCEKILNEDELIEVNATL